MQGHTKLTLSDLANKMLLSVICATHSKLIYDQEMYLLSAER